MKKYYFLFVFLMAYNFSNSQCDKDPRVVESLKKRNDLGRFPSKKDYNEFTLCYEYNLYRCASENDTYKMNGKTYLRTEQEARVIDDAISKLVDTYNAKGFSRCGELEKVKAVYSKKITKRKDQIVGFWIAEDEMHGQEFYPEFYFGNDDVFNMSTTNSLLERGKWKKIDENSYEISYSTYSTYSGKWSQVETTKFVINPVTNTATYYFTNFKNENKTSKWYYKGTAFNMYGLTKEEKLKPVKCSLD